MSPWPQEKIDRLKVLWGEGYSAGRIAELLGGGVTRNAIIGQINRRGIPNRTTVHLKPSWPRQTHAHKGIKPRVVPEPELHEAEVIPPLEPILKPVRARPVVPTVAPKSKRLTFYQLTPTACRYIADERPPWTYCANEALPGKSWCEFHAALCLQTVSLSEAIRRAERAAARYG